MNYIKTFIKSIFIGMGAIAPGLSGGALAMIFGLYERLISAVSHIFTKWRENFLFLVTVGAGAVFGVVAFAGIQRYLLANYMTPTMFVFAGLVVGTIPSLLRSALKKREVEPHESRKNITISAILFGIGLGLGLLLSVLDGKDVNVVEAAVDLNLKNALYLFLAGIVLAGSLVIPGISGTVLLMLIGAYGLFLNAIADIKNVLFIFESQSMFESVVRNLLLLIPIGLGVGVGAILYSKLMEYLLKRFYSFTYFTIIGFVIGSLFELLPEGFSLNREGVLSIILCLIAILTSYHFNTRYAQD